MDAFAWTSAESIQWLAALADAGVKGLAALLLAGGATLLLRRSSAAVRHMTWTLSIVALLLVPVLSLMLPGLRVPVLPDWERAVAPAPAAPMEPMCEPMAAELPQLAPTETPAQALAQGWAEPEPDSGTDVQLRPSPAASDPAVATFEDASAPPTADSAAHWSTWVLLAWLAGAAALLLPLLVGTATVWWRVHRAARVAAGPWRNLLDELRRQLGIRGRVTLLRSGWSNVPVTCGILRPKIVLPAESEDWSPQRRRVVLLHELAHIRRADCLTQLLAGLARVIYWFNPLVWIAGRMLRIEREQACDDLVLSTGQKASDYAQHLLDIVRSLHSARCPSLAAVAMAHKSQLEGRLLAILDPRRSRRVLTRAGALLAVVLAVAIAVPLACMEAGGDPKLAPPVGEEPVAEPTPEAQDGEGESPSSAASLQVRLVDEKGKPVANRQLSLLAEKVGPAGGVLAGGRTDAQGQWFARNIPVGDARFESRGAGKTKPFAIRAGVMLMTLRLAGTGDEQSLQVVETHHADTYWSARRQDPARAQKSRAQPIDPWPAIAWGKAVDGLQAGLTRFGRPSEIHPGQRASFVLLVRNRGREAKTLRYRVPLTPTVDCRGPNGERGSVSVAAGMAVFPRVTVLEPGQVEALGEFQIRFGRGGDDGRSLDISTAHHPGTNRIRQTMEFRDNVDGAWTGKLTTGDVTVILASLKDGVPGRKVAGFGPEKKAMLPPLNAWGGYLFDIDTGRQVVREGLKPGDAKTDAWLRESGADFAAIGTRGLRGFDMAAVRIPDELWGRPLAEIRRNPDVRNVGRLTRVELPFAFYLDDPSLRGAAKLQLSAGDENKTTYYFRTREGTEGLLQLLAISRDYSNGIVVRYRLVQPAEGAWGVANSGVQTRLRGRKDSWTEGQTPEFLADIRNRGKGEYSVVQAQQLCELELDGQRYKWFGDVSAKSSFLPAGREYQNIPITLDKNWVSGAPAEGRRSRDTGYTSFLPAALKPGRHTLRVIFFCDGGSSHENLIVESNAIDFEIAADGTGRVPSVGADVRLAGRILGRWVVRPDEGVGNVSVLTFLPDGVLLREEQAAGGVRRFRDAYEVSGQTVTVQAGADRDQVLAGKLQGDGVLLLTERGSGTVFVLDRDQKQAEAQPSPTTKPSA